MDIFNKIKSLLSDAEKSKAPLIHEMIERDDREKRAFQKWQFSERKDLLYNNIREFLNNPEGDYSNFHLFQNGHSHSFVLYFQDSGMEKDEMMSYFDTLKDRVLDLEYSLYMSDRRIKTEAKNEVKTIERHYLKPKNNRLQSKEKVGQEYGNISIEHHLRDEIPEFVKFTAAYYNDHLYHDAKEFPELLNHLFES